VIPVTSGSDLDKLDENVNDYMPIAPTALSGNCFR
jgi:hypothetical protein